MPWHRKPKKDATSCEKPWGGAHSLRSTDIRTGKPARGECPGTLRRIK